MNTIFLLHFKNLIYLLQWSTDGIYTQQKIENNLIIGNKIETVKDWSSISFNIRSKERKLKESPIRDIKK